MQLSHAKGVSGILGRWIFTDRLRLEDGEGKRCRRRNSERAAVDTPALTISRQSNWGKHLLGLIRLGNGTGRWRTPLQTRLYDLLHLLADRDDGLQARAVAEHWRHGVGRNGRRQRELRSFARNLTRRSRMFLP